MPQIWPHLGEVYRAFLECRISQPTGFDISRISQESMMAWYENNGIGIDERQEFSTIVMALDDVFMKFHKGKNKAT